MRTGWDARNLDTNLERKIKKIPFTDLSLSIVSSNPKNKFKQNKLVNRFKTEYGKFETSRTAK